MKFDNYKFRCHYQGDIVSTPKPLTSKQLETLEAYRSKDKLTDKQKADLISLEYKEIESKKYTLSTTAQKLLNKIVYNEKYKRNTTLKNKYFTKGLECEKKSRDILSRLFGEILTYDTETKSNDWVTGTRDIKHDEYIIDIKTSYNIDSFYLHLAENQSDYYLRQLDCYMELWGLNKSLLCYVLVDTPFNLIDDEIRRLDYKDNILTMYGDVRDDKIGDVVELVSNHIYTGDGLDLFCSKSTMVKKEWFTDFVEIPEKDRVHIVTHKYDKARIEQRNNCLALAREYMNNVKTINNIIW